MPDMPLPPLHWVTPRRAFGTAASARLELHFTPDNKLAAPPGYVVACLVQHHVALRVREAVTMRDQDLLPWADEQYADGKLPVIGGTLVNQINGENLMQTSTLAAVQALLGVAIWPHPDTVARTTEQLVTRLELIEQQRRPRRGSR